MRKRILPKGLKSYVPMHFPYTNGKIKHHFEDECNIETWDITSDYPDYLSDPSYYESNFFAYGSFNPNTKAYNFEDPPINIYFDKYMENGQEYYGWFVSTNNSGMYNLNSSGNYEFELFMYPVGKWSVADKDTIYTLENPFRLILEHENEQGNTVTDLQMSIAFAKEDDKEHGDYYNEGGSSTYKTQLKLQSNTWNLNAQEIHSGTITHEDWIDPNYDEDGLNAAGKKKALLDTKYLSGFFHHITLRITSNIAVIYIDGREKLRASLPSNRQLKPSRLKLGGFAGCMYNYAFWHKAGAGNPEVPTEIYSSTLNVNDIGGFGTGKDGDKAITLNSSTDTITDFNCCGLVSEVTDARTLQVNSWIGGNSGVMASEECEVMIHVTKPRRNEVDEWPYLGMYVFRKIAELNGKTIILNCEIYENKDGFTLSQELADNYYVQIIVVPNYRTFTQYRGAICPVKWGNNKCGGIIVFRTTGNCTINGTIHTSRYGGIKIYDNHQISHSTLLNRFLCSGGGGIIIACGGKLMLGNLAELGGYARTQYNHNGYPGLGGGDTYKSSNGFSGSAAPGKDYVLTNTEEEATYKYDNFYPGGANIVIVANTAVMNDKAIQTGGCGQSNITTNGGGCGFCYMAIGELLDE